MAKQPVPGQIKTRLMPPCTHQQAAALAITDLPRLRDVDTAADAVAVARQAPRSRFAARAREFAAALSQADNVLEDTA
jgi:glycosyltransferase A (GT-A) superfamily protein (DUF2064 family)